MLHEAKVYVIMLYFRDGGRNGFWTGSFDSENSPITVPYTGRLGNPTDALRFPGWLPADIAARYVLTRCGDVISYKLCPVPKETDLWGTPSPVTPIRVTLIENGGADRS